MKSAIVRMLASAVALAFIATGAFVLAQAPKDPYAVTDGPFEIPPLRAGDQARYVLDSGPWAGREIYVEVQEPELFHGPDGAVEAMVIDFRAHPGSVWDNHTYYLDPATGRSLGWQMTETGAGESRFFEEAPLPLGSDYEWESAITFVGEWTASAPCGFWNPYQGVAKRPGTMILPRCGHWNSVFTWEPAMEVKDDAGRTVRFDTTIEDCAREGPWTSYETSACAWTEFIVFRDDVPLPVAFSWTPSWTWILTGFTPGDGRTAHALPESPYPSMRTAPLTPWTVDDSGLDHPFPLSDAYQELLASEDPAWQSYQEENPDAFLTSASFSSEQDRFEERLTWRLVWGTDTTWIEAFVTNHVPGPFLLGLDALPAGDHVAVSISASETRPDGFALPSEIPSQLPLIADLQARFEAIHGEAPEGYGFDILCLDDCRSAMIGRGVKCEPEICPDAWVQLWVGTHATNLEPAVTDPEHTVKREVGEMRVAASGMPLSYRELASENRNRFLPQSPVTPSALGTTDEGPATAPVPAGVPPLAGVLLITAGAAVALGLAGKWLVASLFTRLQRDRLLGHPLRERIHQAVTAEPGIHYHALARRLEVPHSTLRHHLRALERAGLLRAVKGPRHKCYFIAGSTDCHTLRAAPMLRSKGAQRVLAVVLENPGMSTHEVAARLGLSPSSAHVHLRRLEEAGVADGGKVPGRKAWRIVRPQVAALAGATAPAAT